LKHNVYLQTQCLKCGCGFSSDTQWRGPLDMCPRCGCDLAGASAEQMEHENFRSKERAEFATFDRVAVELSAELVSSTGRVLREDLPLKVDLQQLIDRAESLKIASTATALGRLARLQKSTMHDLCHGNGGANLPNLTRLAIVAQVSLAGVMVPSLWRVNPQNASWNLQLPRPKRRCLRDWVRIRAEISGLAAGPDVTSPSAVAKQLNIDPRLFRQRIGGLATEMRGALRTTACAAVRRAGGPVHVAHHRAAEYSSAFGSTAFVPAHRRSNPVAAKQQNLQSELEA
jgi:hypothetical protein